MIPITKLNLQNKKVRKRRRSVNKLPLLKFTRVCRRRTANHLASNPSKFHQILHDFKYKLRLLKGTCDTVCDIDSITQLSPNELLVNNTMVLHSPTSINSITDSYTQVRFSKKTAVTITTKLKWYFIWVLE